MRNKHLNILLSAIFVCLVTCFIFSNSLQGSEASNLQSSFIMNLLRGILDPSHMIDDNTFHFFVRKGAHFSEFFLLGVSLWLLIQNIRSVTGRFCPGTMLFSALAVAVTDEYIQSFTGRTSSVTDVLIDFSGALTAFAVLLLLRAIVKTRRKK